MAEGVGEYIVGLDATQAEESLDNLALSVEATTESLDNLAETAQTSMDSLSESAEAGSDKMSGLANSAQQGGRGMSQISRVVSMFSPQLGKMVAGLGAAMTAFKGLNVVLQTFGRRIIVIAALVTAATFAFNSLFGESEEVKAANEAVIATSRKLSAALEQQKIATDNLASAKDSLRKSNQGITQSFTDLAQQTAVLNTLDDESAKLLAKAFEQKKKTQEFTEKLISQKEQEIAASKAAAAAIEAERTVNQNFLNVAEQNANASVEGSKAQAFLRQTAAEYNELVKQGSQRLKTNARETRALERDLKSLKSGFPTPEVRKFQGALKDLDQAERSAAARARARRIREDRAAKKKADADRKADQARARREQRRSNRESARNRATALAENLAAGINTVKQSTLAIDQQIDGITIQTIDHELERLAILGETAKGEEKIKIVKETIRLLAGRQRLEEQQITDEKNAQLAIDNANIKSLEKTRDGLAENLKALTDNRAKKDEIQKATDDLAAAEEAIADARVTRTKNQERLDDKAFAKKQSQSRERLKTEVQDAAIVKASIDDIYTSIVSLDRSYNDETDPFKPLNDSITDLRSQIGLLKKEGGIQFQEDIKGLEKLLETLEQDVRLQIEAEVQIAKITKLQEAIEQGFEALTDPGSFINTAFQALGSLVGGPAGGAIGGLFGGVFGSIAALGEKTPEEIEQEFDNFLKAFEKGLEILPDILVKILPKFAFFLTLALFKAIPKLIYELFAQIFGLLNQAIENIQEGGARSIGLDPEKRDQTSYGEQFTRNILGGFFSSIALTEQGRQNAADFFSYRSGGRIPSGRSGLRMTQGTGLALLHPNEFVVPQSGMAPQSVNRTLDALGGSNVASININSLVTERNAIDELIRRIEQRFQTFGPSKSTLFAG